MNEWHPQPNSRVCGASANSKGTAQWAVWAPRANIVELVLFDDTGGTQTIAMRRETGGYFIHETKRVVEGQRYAYALDGGPARPDPASRWQPEGVHQPSAVLCPEQFHWSEGNWLGVRRKELIIYELHIGTFTPEGTFDAVIPRLGALRELGVTAIELMPVAQFPGERGWGYDGVYPYAVQASYGGPHGLQQLIKACHRAGLAVILDVVYNHLGPEGNYLNEFGPYFTDRFRTPWGKAVNFDDCGCHAVRAFVLENVRQWIRDYRMDGLRLDASHAIYDFGPRHILGEIKQVAADEARRLGRPVHVIAESNLNDVQLLSSPDRGGYGLDAQWSDDFHHSVHTLLTAERHGYYADFGRAEQLVKALNATFVYDGCHSVYRGRAHGAPVGEHAGDCFVVSIQNHDQVGNRARGDRFGTLLTPAQQRLAAGLLLLAPHVPLIFMGEEYGEMHPFPYFCAFEDPQFAQAVRAGRRAEFAAFKWQGEVPDPQDERTFESAKLSWVWPRGTWHAGLRLLYRDLLAARRNWQALADFKNRTADLVPGGVAPGILRLVRGGPLGSPSAMVAYFNLCASEQRLTTSLQSKHVLLLSSESPQYGGMSTTGTPEPILRPYEFRVFGPALWMKR